MIPLAFLSSGEKNSVIFPYILHKYVQRVNLFSRRAEELEVLVTGLSELDFGELSESTKYDGGYSADHPTVKSFWNTVRQMPTEEQKRLLMFATGSKKVCPYFPPLQPSCVVQFTTHGT